MIGWQAARERSVCRGALDGAVSGTELKGGAGKTVKEEKNENTK